MSVIVYSKPNCMQCMATKRALDTREIDYQSIDLSLNKNALEKVIQLGYREAPVVIIGDKHWSGFRPDLIEQLCAN
ncbi:NrdH-redoxin [Photobacterium phosphoreum]|uniref:Glutaredoxin-like protein NrdH n=1 Tax=Photobacterium phosphoreum TaxID=659 RepID=A0A2T3PPS9_PHOPO|nr:glutaredoxin-like protein NrdH [Photobacterium phosphoreum]MCD9464899.1 NrdH-redoxin [Photobacterium phosphoreum]PSU24663.1 NrdH-redoxin [Photobacterium phosphoreum]PSU42305.1 NrdH-redoxin [Photobacterium phosphoreum]PSU51163.1 NrdH-redoxin [Photobacterium phosphoreum]PSU69771.1 NrdH-redoxin [Photobacterium phosphoreum]